MNDQKKKIIIISSIIVVVLVVILVAISFNKKDKVQNKSLPPILTTEEQTEKKSIENVVGKITTINASYVEVIVGGAEKIKLDIPQSGVTFAKQTKKDNKLISEEIGLFDLPKDKDVEIQYNSGTKKLMMVIVK